MTKLANPRSPLAVIAEKLERAAAHAKLTDAERAAFKADAEKMRAALKAKAVQS